MSTTEQQIAAFTQQAGLLLDLPQNIANTATAQINAVGNAYQARLNTSIGNFYVDQVNGLDTNPGTLAAPLKTITKALSLVPMGGRCQASLVGDYTIADTIVVDNRQLIVLSSTTVRNKLHCTRKLNAAVTPNTREVAGLRMIGQASITLYGLSIQVPALDGQWSAFNGGGNEVLFGSAGSYFVGAQSLAILSCDLNIPDPAFGALISSYYPMTLIVSGVTLTDQPLNGKVVRGITNTAGTATSGVPYLNTTLTTI